MVGIYKIENSVNDRIYIGSSVNIPRRITEHKRLFKSQKHNNPHLLNFVNKYGIKSLIFSKVESCVINDLQKIEQVHIDKLDLTFNICKKAYRPPVKRNLNKDQIIKIANLYNSGKSLNWIAINVLGDSKHRSNLVAIKNGKIYKEFEHLFIQRIYSQVGRKLTKHSRKKIGIGNMFKGRIKEKDLLDIIIRLNNKESGTSIARLYDVDRSVIYNIKNGKTHKTFNHLINK
jgi:group I intron endonuclease